MTISREGNNKVKQEWLATDGVGVSGCQEVKVTVAGLCDLPGIARTSTYRKHKEPDLEREERIMARIDYWHTRMPYLGCRRLRDKLREDDRAYADSGEKPMASGRKLVARLMKEMGIVSSYPKPNLSKPGKGNKKHPYMLRGKTIAFPNQVWAIDITYIKMGRSHMYLTAIIDWHSRYVVGWELSDTLAADSVVRASEKAMVQYGVPAIQNRDQGSQFTSDEYTKLLRANGIRQSMDGRGRWVDNVIIERWFRSFKTEWLYIDEANSPAELRRGIEKYINEYNYERPHEACLQKSPADIYYAAFANEDMQKVA